MQRRPQTRNGAGPGRPGLGGEGATATTVSNGAGLACGRLDEEGALGMTTRAGPESLSSAAKILTRTVTYGSMTVQAE